MPNNIINPIQDPNYQLFKYSGDLSTKIAPEVQIGIEDLVRTGFKDKYNELAQSVIFNIYSTFSNGTSGQQSLVFETSKGVFDIAIVGAGVVQGVGIITADSVIYDATVGTTTITNVEEALDYLLYTPPTISAISGGWSGSYFEVGVNPITSNATVNGNRQIKNLAQVNLMFSGVSGYTNTPTSPVTSSATPSPATQTPVTATILASSIVSPANIVTTTIGTYTLSANVFDTKTPTPNNGVNVASSKSMQLVFPIIFGSSSYDSFSNSVSNVQTTFNTTFMPTSGTTLPGTYLTNGISVPLYRDIIPQPTTLTVIHSNAAYTYFMFPQAYYANITALLNTFRIQDGNTNLNYPYDTDPTIVGGFQDVNTEWRVRPINLTFNPLWSNVPYYLVTSKVLKPKLSILYKF